MTTPYLIAHKVRGEAAFDIAERMACPVCATIIASDGEMKYNEAPGCDECDGEGFWWICSTSGARAYPWWHARLDDIDDCYELSFNETTLEGPGLMPDSLPDHFPANPSPKGKGLLDSLFAAFKPQPKVTRR